MPGFTTSAHIELRATPSPEDEEGLPGRSDRRRWGHQDFEIREPPQEIPLDPHALLLLDRLERLPDRPAVEIGKDLQDVRVEVERVGARIRHDPDRLAARADHLEV